MRYRRVASAAGLLLLLGGCAQSSAGDGTPPEHGIAFSSSRDGDFEIFVMGSDGENVRQLTRNEGVGANEADDNTPSWSPDGSRIAYVSTRDHEGDGSDSLEVYVMAADGGGQTRLTDNDVGDHDPRWSPDGAWLSFLRWTNGGDDGPDVELARMKPDGTEATSVGVGGNVVSAAASPDGSRVALTRCQPEGDELDCEIWLADPDGRGARKLVDSEGRDSSAAWSPDGSRIAFVSDRDENGDCFFSECWGHNGEIYVMDAEGSSQVRLTDDPGEDGSPTWSPDGSRIAFAGLRDVEGAVDGPEEDYEIYVMDADGSDLRQLTDNTAWDWHPDWR